MAKRQTTEENLGAEPVTDESGAPGVDSTSPEVTAIPAAKKERKARTPKGPQLNADELRKFAGYVRDDLKAKRADTSTPLSSLGDLFLLDKKLQQMIGGENVSA